jgi:hypothetical protein
MTTPAEYREMADEMERGPLQGPGYTDSDDAAWWGCRAERVAGALREAAGEAERMQEMREVLEQEAATAPPSDWEPYDRYGDYNGYRGTGQVLEVDEVDPSNSGDVHDHGVAVGYWYFAKVVRRALLESDR